MKHFNKLVLTSTLSLILSACSGFFDKDNTPTPSPLVPFTPTANPQLLWSKSVDAGVGNDHLELAPTLGQTLIFTADKNGRVTALAKQTGQKNWSVETKTALSTGPALNEQQDVIAVGTRDGKVLALQARDGKILWKTQVASEILAKPTLAAGMVLVKTINGQLNALAETDGHLVWRYQQNEPALILHNSGSPQVVRTHVITGFANGNLAKLTLEDGSLLWQKTVAYPQGSFTIQRMVDIDAEPIVSGNLVYAASYQGKLTALDFTSGQEVWSQDTSTYTDLAIDRTNLYLTDASSHLWAFAKTSGTTNWHFSQLAARNLTAPVVMGKYLVVADGEGYLHWLNRATGQLVARVKVANSSIPYAPLVDGNTVYALTKNGLLAAYTLG